MRLLSIISSPSNGGAEILARNIVLRLKKDYGYQPHIVFVSRAADIPRDPMHEARFLEMLDRAGVSYEFIGHRYRRLFPIGMFKLWRICRTFRPQQMHVNLYWGLVFSWLLGVPRVLTVHSDHIPMRRSWLNKLLSRKDQIVALSEAQAASLNDLCLPRAVISNGVDVAEFHLQRSQTMVPPDRKVKLLTVAGIRTEKNHLFILKALAALCTDGVDGFEYHMVGEPAADYRTKIEPEAARLGLAQHVVYHGGSSSIAAYLKQADIFVLGSTYEGLPISLLEATAANMICVTTAVGSCAGVIEQYRNGYIVRSFEVREMADAIGRAIDDVRSGRFPNKDIQAYHDISLEKTVEEYHRVFSAGALSGC